MGGEEGSRWGELVLLTPLYSLKGSELLAKESHFSDWVPRGMMMLSRSHSRRFQSSGEGGRNYSPKSQNFSVSEMAVTGSNSCVPNTRRLRGQASVYTLTGQGAHYPEEVAPTSEHSLLSDEVAPYINLHRWAWFCPSGHTQKQLPPSSRMALRRFIDTKHIPRGMSG